MANVMQSSNFRSIVEPILNEAFDGIYEQRADIMDAETVDDVVSDMRAETANAIVGAACPPNSYPEQWDVAGMKQQLKDLLNLELPIDDWLTEEAIDPEIVLERVTAAGIAAPLWTLAQSGLRTGSTGGVWLTHTGHVQVNSLPALDGGVQIREAVTRWRETISRPSAK